jgi:hypothetical protein
MLREIRRGVAQRSLEKRKRWFQDEYFDLFIWQDPTGQIVQLQLCYERGTRKERALTWKRGTGFDHAVVDQGGGEFPAPRSLRPRLAATTTVRCSSVNLRSCLRVSLD